MPSWYRSSSVFQLLFILLIISVEGSLSTNDNQYQVLKADVGQDVTMSCYFDEDKIDQVSFMRQMTGDILSLGSELFVRQFSPSQQIELHQFSSNRLDLKLISVNQNDSGMYTCMFNDDELAAFLLEIFVPPRFLSYSPLEGSISSAENSSMNFSCRAFAIPPANITWIYRDPKKQSKTIHSGETISIRSLQSTDSGSYECIARNNFHASISRSFYLTVQYSPHVMIFNENVTSDVHESVLVKCRVCSIPELLQINWLRHEQPIPDVNVLTEVQTTEPYQCSVAIMEIVDISEYQFGKYQCRAENALGHNSAYVNIEPVSGSLKRKEEEISPNYPIDLLIGRNSTKSPRSLYNCSSNHRFSWFYSFCLFIYSIRSV